MCNWLASSDKNFGLPHCTMFLKFWTDYLVKIWYKKRRQWVYCHKKHIFTFLWITSTRQVAVHVGKIEWEELHNCCLFTVLWKSMEIFFPWIHTGSFHKFFLISSKIISSFRCVFVLVVMLCYVTYFILFGLLCFYFLSLGLLSWTLGKKKKKFEKDGAMGKLLSYILC